MGDTIEIWSNSKTEEQQMTPEDFGQALEELMAVQAPSEQRNASLVKSE
jgi:MraZ protein